MNGRNKTVPEKCVGNTEYTGTYSNAHPIRIDRDAVISFTCLHSTASFS